MTINFRPVVIRGILASSLLCLLGACQTAHAQTTIPDLRQQGDTKQIVVDGEPMLMLAGELGNSSASSLEYMVPIWPKLADLNLNTVLAPVYWELIEPDEGRFDFDLIDGLIEQARAHEMRLVLLWFGSWKNSMSSYVPAWVKRDQERFPRAERTDGTGMEMLTPFSEANVAADGRAFVALMRHLREVDGNEHTVVMIQVENEIGMIPEARDHSDAANAAYASDVPATLLDYLQAHRESLHPHVEQRWSSSDFATSGNWVDVFGEGVQTEELFMAWYYARYVERITAAGKAAYPLPMYVNAALIRPNYQPGAYSSAGPLPHLIDVWRTGAPSIDFLAPDIYFPNFVEWVRAYDRPGNPLFIPEVGRASWATMASDAFYAIGAHDAMGYSPFSIEDAPSDGPLGQAYDVLHQLMPLILEHQGRGTMAGVHPPVSFDGTIDESPQAVQLGDYVLEVSFTDPWTPRDQQTIDSHGGLIIALDDDTFIVAGTGLTLTFVPYGPGDPIAGIERIEEGTFVDGEWRPGRVLNGDQSHQGRHLRLPPGEAGIQRVKLYRYR
jgi:beta-galactosidase GanA